MRFRRWLAWTRGYNDRRIYTIGDQICMDYVIRYESLLEGVEEVCRRVNVPFQPERLPKLVSKSRSKKHAVADYYDAKTIEIVRQRFRFELEKFEYDFPTDR